MTDRADLVARWYTLTRETMPALAGPQRWPVRFDHCFMRICLDAAFGGPWPHYVARPAIRHMSEAQLAAAIGVAEAIVAEPERLRALNAASLRDRRAASPPVAVSHITVPCRLPPTAARDKAPAASLSSDHEEPVAARPALARRHP